MSKVYSPFIDAHRRLSCRFGLATASCDEIIGFIAAECQDLLKFRSTETLFDGMVERNLLSVSGADCTIRKRMVVNYKEDRYDVFIGRGSPWGNPFIIGTDGNRLEVIEKFKEWIETDPSMVEKVKRELKDKVLGCYCSPLPCHGDALVEIANRD
jgi:hypothetical protein